MASSDLEDYRPHTIFEAGDVVRHILSNDQHAGGANKIPIEERWCVKAELSAGTFGNVRLESSEDGRLRAVKVARKPQRSTTNQLREMRELAALTQFSRSRYVRYSVFVQLHGWFEDPEHVYLAMEYFPLGDLSRYLSEFKSEADIKAVCRQLLLGLEIMHRDGFTHRDLKPSNIFVLSTQPWQIKIGDFGVSKWVKEGTNGTQLHTNTGTDGYMAPEVKGFISCSKYNEESDDDSDDSSVYTNSADLWSLGCVVYQLVAQKLPFPTARSLIKFCREKLPFPQDGLDGKIHEKGVEFIKRLLTAKPFLRPSAGEARSDEWFAQESKQSVETTSQPSTSETPSSFLPSIRFIQAINLNTRSFVFSPIRRTLFPGNETITVGREIPCNVSWASRVSFDTSEVSAIHCAFWCLNGIWYIKDSGSRCGTFLNDQRLSPQLRLSKPFAIKDGDIVRLGTKGAGETMDHECHKCVNFRVELNKISKSAILAGKIFGVPLSQAVMCEKPIAIGNKDEGTQLYVHVPPLIKSCVTFLKKHNNAQGNMGSLLTINRTRATHVANLVKDEVDNPPHWGSCFRWDYYEPEDAAQFLLLYLMSLEVRLMENISYVSKEEASKLESCFDLSSKSNFREQYQAACKVFSEIMGNLDPPSLDLALYLMDLFYDPILENYADWTDNKDEARKEFGEAWSRPEKLAEIINLAFWDTEGFEGLTMILSLYKGILGEFAKSATGAE